MAIPTTIIIQGSAVQFLSGKNYILHQCKFDILVHVGPNKFGGLRAYVYTGFNAFYPSLRSHLPTHGLTDTLPRASF